MLTSGRFTGSHQTRILVNPPLLGGWVQGSGSVGIMRADINNLSYGEIGERTHGT